MHSYSSGQNDRVYQISGKLSSLLSTLESDKGYYIENIEKRLMNLENTLEDSAEQDAKKFKILAEKVSNLQEMFEMMCGEKEEFFKGRLEEMIDFEEKISEEFAMTEGKKRETEYKFGRVIDDRVSSLSSEYAREVKSRKEGFDMINESCHMNLVKIKDLLKKELISREETNNKFSSGVLARIQATKQLVAVEKEAREKAEEALLAMLQDLVARMKREIEEERNDREESEETLLSLLEETCGKLNNISKF